MVDFKNTEQSINNTEFDQFEREFGLNLPKAYKRHILKNNGGKPTLDIYGELRIHYFHSIKYAEFTTLEKTLERIKDILPDDFFPFAQDSGGNQVGFFLNEEEYGKVYIWFHDMDEEDELEYLADSFDEFMKGLTI